MASYFDEHDCEPLGEGEQPNHAIHLARLLIDTGVAMQWEIEFDRLFGGEKKAPPASKKEVEDLPTRVISAAKADLGKCPVCLSQFDEGSEVKTLPCSHEFHSHCILPWLEKINTCPLCRYEFLTDDPDYEEYRKHKARKKQREHELDSLHDSMYG